MAATPSAAMQWGICTFLLHICHVPADKRAARYAVHQRDRQNIGTSKSKPVAPGVHFKTEANKAVSLRPYGFQGHATRGLCRRTGSHHRERSPCIEAAVVPPSLRRLIPEIDRCISMPSLAPGDLQVAVRSGGASSISFMIRIHLIGHVPAEGVDFRHSDSSLPLESLHKGRSHCLRIVG